MHQASHTALLVAAMMGLSAVSSADRLYVQADPNTNLTEPALIPLPPVGQPSAIMISSREVEGIVGKEVRSIADENMGRIIEVVVDRSGQVRAAVIDFGGFFGVGNRRIAVDWNLLRFDTSGDPRGRVTLELTQDQVRAAPEYRPGKAVVIVSALNDPASWQSKGSATVE